jgi:hypothetical protein
MNDSANDSEGFRINVDDVLGTADKLLHYAHEQQVHPLVLMATCAFVVEFYADVFGIPRREVDAMRRETKQLVQALPKE